MKRALSADHDAQFNTFILIPGFRRTDGRSYAELLRLESSAVPATMVSSACIHFWISTRTVRGMYACWLGPDGGARNLKRWCRVPPPNHVAPVNDFRARDSFNKNLCATWNVLIPIVLRGCGRFNERLAPESCIALLHH